MGRNWLILKFSRGSYTPFPPERTKKRTTFIKLHFHLVKIWNICGAQKKKLTLCGYSIDTIAVTPVVIINGGWSSWTSWNTCSKSCGSGKQHRVRQCDNPKPSRNGRTCQGKALDERLCNEQKCPSGMYLRSRYDLESLNTNTPDRHCHIALNPPHR